MIPDHDLPIRPLDEGRLIPLQGAFNFRDLGGYPTADGRTVRRRTVFRSDNLRDLTDGDVATVAALGIRVIHDFRLEHERVEYPSRLPTPAPEVVLLSVGDLPGQDSTMVEMVTEMLRGDREMAPASFWEHHYVDLLGVAQPHFAALLTSLADAERLPALFHCAGGKDRTGLAATLLLHVLGVADDVILDDFLLTNRLRTLKRYEFWAPQMEAKGIDPTSALPILGVTRKAWERAREYLDHGYGGPLGYLHDGGMDPDVPARLRSLLLEG